MFGVVDIGIERSPVSNILDVDAGDLFFYSIGKCAYGIKKFRETALRRIEDAAYPPQADGFASEFLFMNCLPAIIPPFFRPDL